MSHRFKTQALDLAVPLDASPSSWIWSLSFSLSSSETGLSSTVLIDGDPIRTADEVLRSGVKGISDIITISGIINRDFADVKTTMAGMGHAVMGTAVRAGANRAVEAAQAAMASRQRVNQQLQRFQDKGLIRLGYRNIVLLRPASPKV